MIKKIVILFCLVLATQLFAVNDTEAGQKEFDTAIGYYTNSKFLLSIGAFKQAVNAGYTEPKVYFYMGNSYVNIGNLEKAIELYNDAYEASSEFAFQAKTLFNKAYVYHLKEEYENAIVYFDMAYELDSSLAEVFWLKGMSYYRLRDKTNVIAEWETYLSLAPDGEQSDNIRAFLELLQDEEFDFNDYLADSSQSDDSESGGEDDGSDDGSGERDSLGSTEDLIDIEGVLEDVEPSDKGMEEDMEMEDLEM